MAKIHIITVAHNHLEPETERSVFNLVNTSRHEVVWTKTIGDACISRARNEALKGLLSSKFDYLLFIDADILWLDDPKMSNNPIDSLQSQELDIVGGVYHLKSGDYHPSLRTLEQHNNFVKLKTWDTNYEYDIPNKPFEVQYISAGFLMIKKEAVAKICEKHWYPCMPMQGVNEEYLSEDWALCHRAKEIGLKVVADPTFTLGHVGKYIYTRRDYVGGKHV